MKYLIPIVLGIILTSCSTLKITFNYDGSLDWDSYKTYSYYGWNEESTKINPIDRMYIERAFAKEFNARGLSYDKSGQGDIIVSLFVVVESQTTVTRYNSYYGAGPYGLHQPTWGWGYGYGAGYGTPYSYGGVVYEENHYLTGTLVCDVFDRNTKNLAWQGIASKSVETNVQKREKSINYSVSKLMLKYPTKKITE